MPSTGPRVGPGEGRIAGLDGLRALAIIAVLIFHLRPRSLPGGFLGVDVFFVISGFLITTLLVRELHTHRRIDLRRFWIRRARRLLPALVVVVGVSTAAALAAGQDLLVGIGRQVVGALTFSNNWVEIAAGSSYFHQTSPQLFLNFWSLAVEEQFYLFWPLLFLVLMGLTRTGRQRVGILLVVAAGSAIAMAVLYTPGQDATRVYYGTDTHLFGLMIGAALALSAAGRSARLPATTFWHRGRVPFALLALGGLIALMVLLDTESPWTYRGGILLAALLTAAVIAALPDGDNLITRMFSLRPLEWIGVRSYGIYLWHWPVILLVGAFTPRVVADSTGSWIQRGVALVVTLLLAAASYRWIENPVRRHGFIECGRRALDALLIPGRLTPPRMAAVATAACLALFTAAVATAPAQSQVEMAMAEAEEVVGGSQQQADDGDTSDAAASEGEEQDGGSAEEGEDEDPGARGQGAGSDISGFGDSMMYVAAPGLLDQFPGMQIDARSNRQWPEVLEAVRAAEEAGTLRQTVVIAAGTNAGVDDPQLVGDALDVLGPDRIVVLVNLYGESSFIAESNQILAEFAEERSNVVVADWYSEISANLQDLQPDLVHPDWDGMFRFADVVDEALAAQRS